MKPKDDGVLSYLAEIHPTAIPLTTLYWNLQEIYNVDYSRETLKRRIARLVEVGLVEIPRGLDSDKNRFFRISEDGLAYLRGEYKPSELPHDFDGDE